MVLSGGGGGTKMVGWLDGGAPSAQAAPSDADAVTGAQRDPMQLDERRISGAGSNVEAWASGACACVASSPPIRRIDRSVATTHHQTKLFASVQVLVRERELRCRVFFIGISRWRCFYFSRH